MRFDQARVSLIATVLGLCLVAGGMSEADPQVELTFRTLIPSTDQQSIVGVELSPDGESIFAAYWTRGDVPNQRIDEYSAQDYELVNWMGYAQHHPDVCVSPDGRYVFTTSYYSGELHRFDMQNANARSDLSAGGSLPQDLVMTPDGTKVVVGFGMDGGGNHSNDGIGIFNVENGQFSALATVALLDEPMQANRALAISADGTSVYVWTHHTGSSGCALYEVSLDTYEIQAQTPLVFDFSGRNGGIAVSPESIFVADNAGGRIFEVDPATFTYGAPIVDDPLQAPFVMAMHPNGQHLYYVDAQESEHVLKVLDLDSKSVVGSFQNTGGITDIEFSADGRTVYLSTHLDAYVPGNGITVLDVNVVPEPFSMAFMGSAFVGMVGWRLRRRRRGAGR